MRFCFKLFFCHKKCLILQFISILSILLSKSNRWKNHYLFVFFSTREMLPLNCQTTNPLTSPLGTAVSTTHQHQQQQQQQHAVGSAQPGSMQAFESGYSSLTMSPVSSMEISPGVNSGAVLSGAHHHPTGVGYVSPVVTPSPVHTTHPHGAGLSPIGDVKPHCAYARDLYNSEYFGFVNKSW